MLDGPLNLLGYPYGDGYGTMDKWQFLLQDNAIVLDTITQLWDVSTSFQDQLPYGLTAAQTNRAALNDTEMHDATTGH